MSVHYNPLADNFEAEAYSVYAQMRAEEPIHLTALGSYVLTRHADVKSALSDKSARNINLAKTFSERAGIAGGPFADFAVLQYTLKDFILLINGEKHQTFRKYISRLMSPSVLNQAKVRFEQTLNKYSDNWGASFNIDVQADFSVPVAASFTSGMMGFPESDLLWVAKIIRSIARAIDVFVPLNEYAEIEEDMAEMVEYLTDLIEHKRAEPDGSLTSNAVELIDSLPASEHPGVISNLIFLALASSATMNDTIGMAILALLSNREEFSRMERSPNGYGKAADELFRYHSPVEMISRFASEEIVLPSGIIPKDSVYCCILASANRDESVFSDADQLVLSRPKNPHLSFAFGPHTCLGNHAAKYELSTILSQIDTHISKFAPVETSIDWRKSRVFRGVESLRLTRI